MPEKNNVSFVIPAAAFKTTDSPRAWQIHLASTSSARKPPAVMPLQFSNPCNFPYSMENDSPQNNNSLCQLEKYSRPTSYVIKQLSFFLSIFFTIFPRVFLTLFTNSFWYSKYIRSACTSASLFHAATIAFNEIVDYDSNVMFHTSFCYYREWNDCK